MNKGILYLAFGTEFDKLTAASAAYSRRFTNLPMHVISNLQPIERSHKWQDILDVTFTYMPIASNENRFIKVSLIDYTPFQETLFLDSDAVIQKLGIDSCFAMLQEHDITCQFFDVIQHENDSRFEKVFVAKTYEKLRSLLDETYPIELMAEAAILFRKTRGAKEFFTKWHDYWVLMGKGRDMPAFSFAVKHMRNQVLVFTRVLFATNKEDERFFIQHKGFSGFEKKFGLPTYQDWDPQL